MPKKRQRSSNSQNVIRGPIAILFLVIVVAIYLYQQYEEGQLRPTGGSGDITVIAPPSDIKVVSPSVTPDGSGQPGSIQAWFTNPTNPDAPAVENNLIEAINRAQKTIDIAIYNLTMENVSVALIEAHQRGVVVRVVMESEAMEKKVPQSLSKAGIPIQGDNREALMHNKFIIIDGQEVWTGSLNLAPLASKNDYNNLVRIRSQRVAQNYTVEFNEMFVEGLFGPTSRANTPYPRVSVDGSNVEVYFSAEDGVAQHVIDTIKSATTSIDFMVYSFTSDEIADALRDRAAAGVKVRGVFDESQVSSNKGGEYDPLLREGFDVHLDGISGLLHHKVFVIDGKVVITGSYNFSASAERSNDENLVILHNSGIAQQYLQAFDQVYQEAK